jgi:hypothetical protein
VGDYCALGLCLSGASLACDDGLACTLDHCEGGRCKNIGDLGPVLKTCKGPDVRVPPPCTGMTEHTEPCPPGHPCVDGACSLMAELDAGGLASDGAGLADQALGPPGDAVTGTAAMNASPSPASGCSARRTPAGASWAAALALFALAAIARRRIWRARG